MTGAAWGLAGVVITVLGGVIVALLKNSGGSPESRTAEVAAWNTLNGAAVAEVKRLTERMGVVETEVEALRGADEMLHRAYQYIAVLIPWGRAGGGDVPPEPPPGFTYPSS